MSKASLRRKLMKLSKQKEFEERYEGKSHLISPLAEKIDSVKAKIIKQKGVIKNVY